MNSKKILKSIITRPEFAALAIFIIIARRTKSGLLTTIKINEKSAGFRQNLEK